MKIAGSVIIVTGVSDGIGAELATNKRTVVTPELGWFVVAACRLFPALVQAQLAKIHDRQHPSLQ